MSRLFESIINLKLTKNKSASELNRILDTANEAIQEFPVEHWDRFLVYLVVRKLDEDTQEGWKISLKTRDDFPNYADLTGYLDKAFSLCSKLSLNVSKF